MAKDGQETTPKSISDDVLDAEFTSVLNLEYNAKTGAFKMSGNIRDEILTVGMLEVAKSRMKENYDAARIQKMREDSQNAIIAPGVIQ